MNTEFYYFGISLMSAEVIFKIDIVYHFFKISESIRDCQAAWMPRRRQVTRCLRIKPVCKGHLKLLYTRFIIEIYHPYWSLWSFPGIDKMAVKKSSAPCDTSSNNVCEWTQIQYEKVQHLFNSLLH